jgi:hypothetical protein
LFLCDIWSLPSLVGLTALPSLARRSAGADSHWLSAEVTRLAFKSHGDTRLARKKKLRFLSEAPRLEESLRISYQ